jgi:hypothetical protein
VRIVSGMFVATSAPSPFKGSCLTDTLLTHRAAKI